MVGRCGWVDRSVPGEVELWVRCWAESASGLKVRLEFGIGPSLKPLGARSRVALLSGNVFQHPTDRRLVPLAT